MTRILLTASLLVLFAANSSAQLKVIDHGVYQFINGMPVLIEPAGTEDLSNTTVDVDADNMNGDNEHAIWVVNEGSEELTIRVVRTEVNVPTGTLNNVCWGLCPIDNQPAGDQPVWVVGGSSNAFTETLAPGDTAISFAFHHYPNGVDGCSLYQLEFYDNATLSELYTSFSIRFDHSASNSCAVGLNDLNDNVSVTLAPNPSNNQTYLNLEGVERTVGVQVMNLLGKVVMQSNFMPNSDSRLLLNTSGLRNGIYFVSILDQEEILRTMKLVVKH